MNITEYAKLPWEEQLRLVNEHNGYKRVAVLLGYAESNASGTKVKGVTKPEAASGRAIVVLEQRRDRFKKNIVDKRAAINPALQMGSPTTPPQSGIISEPASPKVLIPEPVVRKEKSLQQLESEVDCIVREVLSRYG